MYRYICHYLTYYKLKSYMSIIPISNEEKITFYSTFLFFSYIRLQRSVIVINFSRSGSKVSEWEQSVRMAAKCQNGSKVSEWEQSVRMGTKCQNGNKVA